MEVLHTNKHTVCDYSFLMFYWYSNIAIFLKRFINAYLITLSAQIN